MLLVVSFAILALGRIAHVLPLSIVIQTFLGHLPLYYFTWKRAMFTANRSQYNIRCQSTGCYVDVLASVVLSRSRFVVFNKGRVVGRWER
jgi:hypothetical protein